MFEQIFSYEDVYNTKYKIQGWYPSFDRLAQERVHEREEDKKLRGKQFRNKTLRNRIQRVKFDNPWTIVWWDDGSITRVKCSNLDTFSEEAGLMAAICKHYYEDTHIFGEMLHKWCKPTQKECQIEDINTAYDDGYDDGYATGYDEGYSEGQFDGRAEEQRNSYDEGYAIGRSAGYDEGYTQGYHDGKEF